LAANAPTTSLVPLRKAADVLLQAGLIRSDQHAAVWNQVQRMQVRSEEAILELGLVSEPELLKALSAHYKTRFITTEKLAKADIPRTLLDIVPRKVAERYAAFPVLYDAHAKSLTVVTADPDNLEILDEIALVSDARDVKPILARPAAVKAAIAKHYAGEAHAFARLDRNVHGFDRNLVAEDAAMNLRERVVSERDIVKAAATGPQAGAPAQKKPPPLPARPVPPPAPSAPAVQSAPVWSFGGEAMLEMLNVFVSLLENSRAELRGHSAQVSRLVRRLVERVRLPRDAMIACCSAGFIHDLGKMGQYHLTALNASEYEGHRVAAQKAHDTPGRLLEAVRLPPDALKGVAHMYERYDGNGFPNGLSGKEIPIAARILALCDTYADLTQNPRNPYRKILSPADAFGVVEKFKETIFDPHLVDMFRVLVTGEDVRAKLLANRWVALLVDADPEETTVLELRLIEQGFEVKTARTIADAMRMLAAGDVDLVVSEVEMPSGDGLALLEEARKQPWGKDLPWVMHTRRQGRAEAQRAFELGVLDYASKVAPTDVFVAKLKVMLDQRATGRMERGVSGDLEEMGLGDMVQVLFHARKTGNLKLRSGNEPGEVHFKDGNVVDAVWGNRRGADAFYAMLKVREGEFAFDPTFKPTTRVIEDSPEALLLEGMRRLDEGID
jgi:response regulator RpfG family c-di-GMP phosphodiesterase